MTGAPISLPGPFARGCDTSLRVKGRVRSDSAGSVRRSLLQLLGLVATRGLAVCRSSTPRPGSDVGR